MSTVAVVGGGISGLAAARALAAQGLRVTVFEGSGRVGGALKVSEFAGVPVDEGADAFLVRVPHARALAESVGAQVVHPAARAAGVLVGGRVRPLPRTALGVPLDLAAARGILGAAGTARAAADLVAPPTPYAGDVSVGAHLRRRLGGAVVDRLVEPLLGGVYAGDPDLLSLAATLPQLHDPSGSSLIRRAQNSTPAPSDAPVFGSLPAGLGSLPALVAEGLDVRLDAPVTSLARTPDGWRLEIGSRAAPEPVDVDAVVLAVPASRARKLLQDTDTEAAQLAGSTDYASVGIVTLAYPLATSNDLRDRTLSGWLVPPGEGRVVKAVTVASSKWARIADAAPDLAVVRASVGRYGREQDLQRDDRELVGVVSADIAAISDVKARPVEARVTRWGGALPQYAPGHLDRVRQLRERLPATLAVCGAAYDGVGIPACIASGERAAARIGEWAGARE